MAQPTISSVSNASAHQATCNLLRATPIRGGNAKASPLSDGNCALFAISRAINHNFLVQDTGI